MNRPDGYYDGIIQQIDFEDDQYNDGQMVAVFRGKLTDPDETGIARHPFGKWSGGMPLDDAAGRFKSLLDKFGIDHIKHAARLSQCEGEAVQFRLKTTTAGKQRWYVATGKGGKKIDQDEINRRLADMAEETPF